MKFWYASDKNLTAPIGRFVFVMGASASSASSPDETEAPALTPEAETLSSSARETAILDTEMALADLQAQIENQETLPSDLPIDEQVLLLVRIARNDFQSDSLDGSGDDRTNLQWIRDSIGSVADNIISTDLAQALQRGTDFSYEGAILDLLAPSAKTRFLLDYRDDARNLFTDTLATEGSRISYRANFYGDTDLARQANFMDLLSPIDPNQQYLQINNELYVRTPHGYLGFSPDGIVGNRARIGSDTNFTTFGDADLLDTDSAILTQLKAENPVFSNIENSDEMARLEQNRNTNFYTAQAWKNFSDSINGSLLANDLPFITEIKTLFVEGGSFRTFLDANTRRENYNDLSVGESFNIPGFESVPGLDALSNPADFRDGILLAIQKIVEYAEAEVQKYETAIAAESNPETSALMIASLKQLKGSLPDLLQAIDIHVEELKAENEALIAANTQLILAEFENLSPEELSRWLEEFDSSLEQMARDGSFNSESFNQQLGILIARILGSSDEDGALLLEQNPQLKQILLARLNTLSRQPGINDLEGAVIVFKNQMYVAGVIEALGAINPAMVEGIDPQSMTPEQLNQLIVQAQQVKQGLEMRLVNDDSLSEDEQRLLDFLVIEIPSLQNSLGNIAEGEEIREEAQAEERVYQESIAQAEEVLEPSTEEGQTFHETVDIATQYIQEYRVTHNGEMPEFTTEDFQYVTERVQNGEAPDDILYALHVKSDPSFQTSPPREQAQSFQNLNTMPSGTNMVGLTPEGDYIIESSGTDQTRFIQNSSDGTIIAEHLLGVPDSEDLRVPASEWATAQALGAMTDGFVVKSAAELAQAGETLGNRALVNFMKQYWGIRGNNTLPESELDKFKSLGEMMSDNHINLHTILAQLNALKWDNTADGSRALSVRNQFNEILEAAAAGNNRGFRELLNLDNLPPTVPTEA
ncbi:hypothetical protein GW756_04045 [bacterium]|nr:hypothetical protein [bacterium]NCQ55227.1 hypothetical protein [Candidatus Parcubacteria bacterium]NCS67260.1 hypothetical protein [Candidatus Peregrinibacteria bacterium]NCS96515.1 hypothetical protein [bacterium]